MPGLYSAMDAVVPLKLWRDHHLQLGLGFRFCDELGLGLGLGLGLALALGLGLEEVFVFDSKSENRDRAVEAVSEARAVELRSCRAAAEAWG